MKHDIHQLIQQVKQNTVESVRAAARLMSLIENHPTRFPELFAGMAHWPEPRMVVGLTGPPGAGKSTLADHLITQLRRNYPQRRVGVIAVDPSSPFTGGAVLGDRVRMMRHATDPLVFIRSSAARGHLGGLTLGVKGTLRIMGLLGCDVVLIETVGVGQSEIEIAKVADVVVIILAPGQGDGVQLLKAGLMEAGDIFVVNKADRQGAYQLHAQLLSTLQLAGSHNRPRGKADVCLVSALEDKGINELLAQLENRHHTEHQQWKTRRIHSIAEEIQQAIFEESRQQLIRTLTKNGMMNDYIQRILQGETTITELTKELLHKTVIQTKED